MPDARIGRPRRHRLGQPRQVVRVAEEQAARVRKRREPRERARRRRDRCRRRRQRRLGIGIVGRDDERRLIGRILERFEARVARIEHVVAQVDAGREALADRDVGQEQRVCVDEHALALRVRLACDDRRTHEAVGESLLHTLFHGSVRTAGERVVLSDELHEVADALELHDLVGEHHAAVHALLADAAAQVRGEQERLAELIRGDLDPDLVVLLPKAEEARRFLGVLDHIGEWPRLPGRNGGGCGGGGCRSGRWRAHAMTIGLGRARRGHRGRDARGGGVRGNVALRARREARAGRQSCNKDCASGGAYRTSQAIDRHRTTSYTRTAAARTAAKKNAFSTPHAAASSARNECGSAAVIVTST